MARILLIDDDKLLRDMLATTLASAGHHVIQAENGHEGTRLFRASPADLIITDIIMPEREGIETIIALHNDRPDVPILAITGSPHGETFLRLAASLGASATLAKPFSGSTFLRTVDELLGPQSQPPPSP